MYYARINGYFWRFSWSSPHSSSFFCIIHIFSNIGTKFHKFCKNYRKYLVDSKIITIFAADFVTKI